MSDFMELYTDLRE